MAERQKRIPFRALSKNFQDAVVATRALGFRYLWIDSLCIIQDSKEDWDIESARMELVYRNAACTLSASKSADGNGGLFMPRDYRINRPFWLPISPGVDGGQIEPSEKGTFWQPTGIRPTGPLYPRAWVFQEQVLSGRTVAFCSNRVFWDCLTRTESEVNIGSISGAPGAGPFIKFKRLVTQFDSQSCEEAGRTQPLVEAAYAAWYDMLNHYSWRSITYDIDRLTALSSVARMMSRLVNDQYAAGIWRHDLTRSLLWTCDCQGGNRSKPPLKYVAPSWSWASVRSGLTGMDVRVLYWQESEPSSLRTPLVLRLWGTRQPRVHDSTEYGIKDSTSDLHTEEEEDVMEILGIEVELDGQNTFGRVVAGYLRLKGWVKSARVAVSPPMHSLFNPDSGDRIGACDFDEELGIDIEGREVFCVLAAWDQEYFDFGTSLVLVPTGLGTSEYRRIGLGGAKEKYWDDVEAMRDIVIV